MSAVADGDIFKLTLEKVYLTIATIFIPIFFRLLYCPTWGIIHLRYVTYLRVLGEYMKGGVRRYFSENNYEDREKEEERLKSCTYILANKSDEEDLIRYSRWESIVRMVICRKVPFPCKEYVQLQKSISELAGIVLTLQQCTPINDTEGMGLYDDWCKRVASEISNILTHLAISLEKRQLLNPESFNTLRELLKEMNDETMGVGMIVNRDERETGRVMFSDILNNLKLTKLTFFPSLLMEAVWKLERIILAIGDLGQKSGFKTPIPFS